MDGSHPNRKKDKQNPYTLSIENNTYYISFTDGQGIAHKMHISTELYTAFDSFELDDISQMNKASRHLEQSELTEESLNHRTAEPLEPVDDFVFRRIVHEELHKAIAQLPAIQRRRLLLYYFGGYTYGQIAEMEGCKHSAIIKSVEAAKNKLKKALQNWNES